MWSSAHLRVGDRQVHVFAEGIVVRHPRLEARAPRDPEGVSVASVDLSAEAQASARPSERGVVVGRVVVPLLDVGVEREAVDPDDMIRVRLEAVLHEIDLQRALDHALWRARSAGDDHAAGPATLSRTRDDASARRTAPGLSPRRRW